MPKRRTGTAFPTARIKKMMQADEDVGKIGADAPFLVAKALELLLDDLIRNAANVAHAKNTRTITASHLKFAVGHVKAFDFLRAGVAQVPDVGGVDPGVAASLRLLSASSGSSSVLQRREEGSKSLKSRKQAPLASPESGNNDAAADASKRKRGRPRKADTDKDSVKKSRESTEGRTGSVALPSHLQLPTILHADAVHGVDPAGTPYYVGSIGATHGAHLTHVPDEDYDDDDDDDDDGRDINDDDA
ncbi:Dr1-associated corepressor [Porphyridium purpureum]|uniref:Dr1-associated corepressor n=1 Tax=Porphyridium purpureum TaxID=35688 RepID=A0A5J4YXS7_PORPP|nr:Dr1-associated corepressor [Porphyridium purpureum]|eukprot:POR2218..scf208_2